MTQLALFSAPPPAARPRPATGKRPSITERWEECRENLRVKKLGEYRLNNDFTALYARRLIELEPRLEGVIELRKRKAK